MQQDGKSDAFARLPDESATAWFDRLATQLMCATRLRIRDSVYRIVELEVYLHNESHPDPYVHKNARQLTHAEWYFHRAGSATKRFTLKGVDITFGSEASHTYGGILLRALEDAKGRIIEGPSLVVNEILDKFAVESVSALHALPGWQHTALTGPCALEAARNQAALVKCARVGLKAKPGAEQYHTATYRYHAEPKRAKKGKRELATAVAVKSA